MIAAVARTGPPEGIELIGQELDGYVLEAKIGSGATGVVYRARQRAGDAVVAIKVLNENLGHISSLRRRFEREARALSRLTHPRIVNITDFGVTEEATFIAMELLDGDTLEDVLQDGPIAPARAVSILEQALEGVAFAHELQIVHRDLKPANIFLQLVDGQLDAKVLDFGLAKFLSIDELSQEATLTRKGRIVGTPAYMAPEQITGVSLDVRADVYAAGVVLFELLADRRPFDYNRRSQLLRAHLFEPVPSLRSVRPGLRVHPELEAVVRRALAKDPGQRYASAGEMLAALKRLPAGAVSIDRGAGGRRRRRVGTTSEIISEEERRAITSEVSGSGLHDLGELDAGRPEADSVPPMPPPKRDSIPLGSLPPTPSGASMQPTSRPPGRKSAAAWWVAAMLAAIAAGGGAFWVVLHL